MQILKVNFNMLLNLMRKLRFIHKRERKEERERIGGLNLAAEVCKHKKKKEKEKKQGKKEKERKGKKETKFFKVYFYLGDLKNQA